MWGRYGTFLAQERPERTVVERVVEGRDLVSTFFGDEKDVVAFAQRGRKRLHLPQDESDRGPAPHDE
jgi:hypothetical protein